MTNDEMTANIETLHGLVQTLTTKVLNLQNEVANLNYFITEKYNESIPNYTAIPAYEYEI